MLSDIAFEGVETSNASVMSISESSIHSGDGVSVGLHGLAACIATTNASTTVVSVNVPSYGTGSGRLLLAALMEV